MLNNFGLRQRELLTLLMEQRHGLTVDELVKRLDVTRTAVNQHLQALEPRGYVAKGELVKTKGRPGYRYILTPQGIDLFPKQYAWFAGLLLGLLKNQVGAEAMRETLAGLGIQVAKGLMTEMSGGGFNARLEGVVAVMQQLGYTASVESSEEGEGVIRAHNCVYHDLAQEHNEVCQFDIALLSNLLGAEVEQQSCMAHGDDCCRFCAKKQIT